MRGIIRRIGAWNKLMKMSVNLAKDLQEARVLCLKRWALKAESIAKKHMGSQDLANSYWPSLSPDYVAWKAKQGFSTDTLIMSSTYFQSIVGWVDVYAEQAYVGVKSGKKYRTSTGSFLEVADVVRMQEFGTSRIPKRPLFEPTFNEAMQWHEKFNKPGDIFKELMLKKYSIKF